MKARTAFAIASGSWAFCAAACTGSIVDEQRASQASSGSPSSAAFGGNGSSAAGSGGTSGQPSGAMPEPTANGDLPYTAPPVNNVALPARVWRLSHAEYQRSVQAFLGVKVDIEELPGDIDSGVYPNMSGTNFVRVDSAAAYSEVASTVTDGLTSAQLKALIPCGDTSGACKDEFLRGVVTKAFRRPANAEDLARYAAVFEAAGGTSDATLPYRSVLRALLTSPFFLYRTEVGDIEKAPVAAFRTTDYEVASFLSYGLLGAPPSAELLSAAARGELTNPSTLSSAVTKLLDDPGAAAQLSNFLFQWLKLQNFGDVTKFEESFPGFAAQRDPMLAEARAFLSQNGVNATLPGLLTDAVPAAGGLDRFYRSDASGMTSAQHTGILGLGATLSLYAKAERSSPTLRGLFVRERLLCQHVSLPPTQVPDISDTAERSQPKTTRELYELHASDPTCKGCHRLLDPVGFTLEQLDGAGRFRTQENGVAVDPSGDLVDTDVNGTYRSQAELAAALARSNWVRECLSRQAFRFYFGEMESDRGIPSVNAAFKALEQSGKLKDLLQSLLTTSNTIERTRG